MLSRSSSIAEMSFPNCFKLSAIICSSSVWFAPIHSKLNSFKLFANVLWHLDKSGKKMEEGLEFNGFVQIGTFEFF